MLSLDSKILSPLQKLPRLQKLTVQSILRWFSFYPAVKAMLSSCHCRFSIPPCLFPRRHKLQNNQVSGQKTDSSYFLLVHAHICWFSVIPAAYGKLWIAPQPVLGKIPHWAQAYQVKEIMFYMVKNKEKVKHVIAIQFYKK